MTATQTLRSDSLPTVGTQANDMTAIPSFISQEYRTTDSPATQPQSHTADSPATRPEDSSRASDSSTVQPETPAADTPSVPPEASPFPSPFASWPFATQPNTMNSTALQAIEPTGKSTGKSCDGSSDISSATPADILPSEISTPLYRTVEPQEIFGAASTRTTEIAVPAPDPKPLRPLTDTPYFETLVLLLTAAYAIFLYRHLNDIVLLLGRVFRPRASHERLVDASGGGNNILRFLNIAAVIGLFVLGAAITRYADTQLPAEETAAWPRELLATASLLVAAVGVAIIAYQSLVLKTVGAVTLSLPFMDQIWTLKRTYFALAAIVAAPVFLLLALVPSASGTTWFYILAGESAVTAILCLRETSQLFLAKKIPILYWFLYLCVVEIFPFSLLWLIATR